MSSIKTVQVDPEQPYEYLGISISLSQFFSLPFNYAWMVFVTLCHIIAFYVISFGFTFLPKDVTYSYLYPIEVFCLVVGALDVALGIRYHYKSKQGYPFAYHPNTKFYLSFMTVLIFTSIITMILPKNNLIVKWLHLSGTFIRGVFKQAQVVSVYLKHGDDEHPTLFCIINFIMHVLHVIQWFSVCWRELCPECEKKDESKLTIWEIYFSSVFFVLGGLTNISVTGAALANVYEVILLIGLSVISITLMKCGSFSWFTLLVVNRYSLDRLVATRINQVKRYMSTYLAKQSDALHYQVQLFSYRTLPLLITVKLPDLYDVLPRGIKLALYADTYRILLNISPMLRILPYSARFEFSDIITTEFYTAGSPIYDETALADKLIFVAAGSVRLMTDFQNESPIVRLSIGTCFGTSYLLLPRVPNVAMFADSFCILHVISYQRYWRMMVNLNIRHATVTRVIRSQILEARLDLAFRKQHDLEPITMGEVKASLLCEMFLWRTQHDQRLKGSYFVSTRKIRYADPTCLKTSWLCRLRPGSYLLQYWSLYMICLISAVMLIYPVAVVNYAMTEYPDIILTLQILVMLSYMMDLAIVCTTAVFSERGFELGLSLIFWENIVTWIFALDIIAAFPIGLLMYVLKCGGFLQINRIVYCVFQLHDLIKCCKLPHYIKILSNEFSYYETLKGFVSLLYFNYLWTCLYYIIFAESDEASWVQIISTRKASTVHKIAMIYSYILADFTLSGDYSIQYMREVYFIAFINLFGIIFYIYIMLRITASIMVRYQPKANYYHKIYLLEKYLKYFKLKPVIQQRIHDYLTLQWMPYSGTTESDIFQFLSPLLTRELKVNLFYELLKHQIIFAQLDKEVLTALSLKCKTMMFPPNHVIVMEGQLIFDLYIVARGNCEMFTSNIAVSGLVPKSAFCMLEMLLDRPSYYTIVAATNVVVVSISKKDIDNIIRMMCPQKVYLERTVTVMNEELFIFAPRVFRGEGKFNEEDVKILKAPSWITFSRIKKRESYIDYNRPLQKIYKMRMAKHLLMRKTIHPEGDFRRNYDIYFSIIIIIVATVHPMMPLLSGYYDNWQYVGIGYLLLLVLLLTDVYLRLHMAYYDSEGLLISHPWYTAQHYLKTSCITDVMALLPLDIIIIILLGNKISKDNYLRFCFTFNKLLYLYRFEGLLYIRQDIISATHVFKMVGAVLPVIVVVMNSLTMVYMYLVLGSDNLKEDNLSAIKRTSWYYDHYNGTHLSILTLYGNGFYWTMLTTLGSPPLTRNTFPWRTNEILLIKVCTIIGYFIFIRLNANYVIISNRTNEKLLEYQLKLIDLTYYMRRYKLKNRFLRWIYSDLENNWCRRNGVDLSMLGYLNDALRNACAMQIFSNIFQTNPLFSVYANDLGTKLNLSSKAIYLLKYYTIIDLNDVTSKMYILAEGRVLVLNAAHTVLTVLSMGSLFGNIDECKRNRSMLEYIAMTNVCLIELDTMDFYAGIQGNTTLKNQIARYTNTQNLCYFSNDYKSTTPASRKALKKLAELQKSYGTTVNKYKTIIITPLRGVLDFALFVSVYWIAYKVGFTQNETKHNIIFYAFDAGFVVRCFVRCLDKRYGRFNILMTSREVAVWYIKTQFPLDIITLLPLELIPYLWLKPNWTNIFRINRLLRFIHFYGFIMRKRNTLTAHFLAVSIARCLIEITFFGHICSCILYFVACPHGKCLSTSWIQMNAYRPGCSSAYYLCSVLYTSTIMTQSGFGTFFPESLSDRATCAIMIFISRIFMLIISARIFMTIKYFTCYRFAFIFKFEELKLFLKTLGVTPIMVRTIYKYLKNLFAYQGGHQEPALVQELPLCAKTALKCLTYGHHLFNNPLFESCHPDFLRQLSAYAYSQTYFAGDVICHIGEINDTIYFIHEGSVEVILEKDATHETLIDELRTDDVFGVIQGFYKHTPHSYTFRALSVTTLVLLTYDNWEHLLWFFPASKSTLYQKLDAVHKPTSIA